MKNPNIHRLAPELIESPAFEILGGCPLRCACLNAMSVIDIARRKAKRSYADQYLSPWHRDNPGDGCTMAALGQEVARSTPELKGVFERGLEEYLSAMGVNWKEAIFQTAAMIGGVVLARAVQDQQFSDEILMSVRQKLS
jgi:TetR/AcrR family transcriptional repressor of nem operon